MPAIISGIESNSIAEELNIQAGDILLNIDGNKLQDMIDYQYFMKSELLTIEIQKKKW